MPNTNGKQKQQNTKKNFKHKKFDRDKKYPKSDESAVVPQQHNSIDWYVSDQQLLKDVASLPFSNMLGTKTSFADVVGGRIEIPGIAVLNCLPTLGGGETAIDAPTVAARNIYSFIRHANSGSANYEAPDLFMMLAAHASAQAWLEDMKRCYGVIRHFSVRNKYYGRTITEACGYDYDYWVNHINDLRAFINLTAAKLNTIKIPSNFALAERWKWISSGLIVDDNGAKPQTYITKFTSYLRWDGYGSQTGTRLITTPRPHMTSMEQLSRYTALLIDTLYYEEDVGIMSGDMIKAYQSNVSEISSIPEDYVVLPSFDDVVRLQIHNAITLADTGEVSQSIYQSEGVIKNIISITIPESDEPETVSRGYAGEYLLNAYTDEVTPDLVMRMTRFVPGTAIFDTANRRLKYTNTGTEVVTSLDMYYDASTDAHITTSSYPKLDPLFGVPLMMSMFDWHPILYVRDSQQGEVIGLLGDLENYTVVESAVIDRLNAIAVLGETNITSRTTIK